MIICFNLYNTTVIASQISLASYGRISFPPAYEYVCPSFRRGDGGL